jgi:hypothetical protein
MDEHNKRTQINKRALVEAYMIKKEMNSPKNKKVLPNRALSPAKVSKHGIQPSSTIVHQMQMPDVLEVDRYILILFAS